MHHRNPEHSVRVCGEKGFIKPRALRTEDKIRASILPEGLIGICLLPLLREEPELIAPMLLHEGFYRVMHSYIHFAPVIEACMPDTLLGDIESERADKVQPCPGNRACARYVAGILRYFRMEEAYAEHGRENSIIGHLRKGLDVILQA